MTPALTLRAAPGISDAIAAIHDLLTRLKIDHMFVGAVGEAAWTGSSVDAGSVDVLVMVTPERKGQIPMMASNRGFIVDRDAVEAADELDVVPLAWGDEVSRVRIHVLIASNALYGRMFGAATPATLDELNLLVPSSEDVVLMMMVGDRDERDRRGVIDAAGERFDRERLNVKLRSIGLERNVIA